MEYAKAHPKLLYSYSLLIIIAVILLIQFATPSVLAAYTVHWLALAVAVILCLLPFGHLKIVANTSEKPRYSFWHWLIRLFALQGCLFFVFIGMTLVFFHWLPVGNLPNVAVIPKTLNILLKQDGLLPWGIYAAYAAGFAYLSYRNNQDVYVSSLISPLFHKKPDSLFSIGLNLQGRSCVFIALTTTFALMTLLMATLITPHHMPLLTGFHGKTMIIVLALILLGFTPPFKKIIKKLLHPKIPLAITTAITLILFALFIGLLNAFFGALGQHPLPVPAIIQWFERKDPITLWIIFSATWWIAWTPLIAAHIAKLSRGYRIRSMIIATLILPAIFTVLFTLFPKILFILNTIPILMSIIAVIAFFYLLMILTEKTSLPLMIRSYLPRRDTYKRRDYYFYFRKLFQVMLIIIYLYLPTGIAINVYVILTMTVSFMLQIPFALFGLFRLCKQ